MITIKESLRLLLIFIIALFLSYIFLYTGIWLLVILAGLISSVVFGKDYIRTLIISFLAGLISSLLFLSNYIVMGGSILKISYYAGEAAGIPGILFIIISLLLNGIYILIGSVIGIYIKKIL